MKKLPSTRMIPAPDWQRQCLQRWLAEWHVDRSLPRTPDTEPLAKNRPPGPIAAAPRDAFRGRNSVRYDAPRGSPKDSVAAGQIRLFQPVWSVAHQRLLYVAVIREDPPDSYLIAPFSRFTEPATPGEWRTGRSQPGWRVLCLWNARALPADVVRRSWLVDRLTDAERIAAEAVWSRQVVATDLPGELLSQVGPPLSHPLDPRQAYLEEEKPVLDALAGPARPPTSVHETSELALAAETRAIYGEPSRFAISGTSLILRVSMPANPAQRRLTVTDQAGHVSAELDGSVLRAPAGTTSQPITQGQVVVPARLLVPGLELITVAGATHALQPLR